MTVKHQKDKTPTYRRPFPKGLSMLSTFSCSPEKPKNVERMSVNT